MKPVSLVQRVAGIGVYSYHFAGINYLDSELLAICEKHIL